MMQEDVFGQIETDSGSGKQVGPKGRRNWGIRRNHGEIELSIQNFWWFMILPLSTMLTLICGYCRCSWWMIGGKRALHWREEVQSELPDWIDQGFSFGWQSNWFVPADGWFHPETDVPLRLEPDLCFDAETGWVQIPVPDHGWRVSGLAEKHAVLPLPWLDYSVCRWSESIPAERVSQAVLLSEIYYFIL